jgi:hypothetical protein
MRRFDLPMTSEARKPYRRSAAPFQEVIYSVKSVLLMASSAESTSAWKSADVSARGASSSAITPVNSDSTFAATRRGVAAQVNAESADSVAIRGTWIRFPARLSIASAR